jgi:hypothetical protein
MKFVLYLKPWKLFLVFFICIIASFISSVGLIVDLACWMIYTGWVYHIGVSTYELVPDRSKPGSKYFKFSCVFIPLVIILMVALQIGEDILNIHFKPVISYNVILLIFPIYVLWSWVYISMYAARMLESVIEGKLLYKSDAMKGFVCFFVFPIGVWYIQPAIQKILNENKTITTN